MNDNTGARAGDGRPERVGVYDQNKTRTADTAEPAATNVRPAEISPATTAGGSATRWIIAAIVVVLLIIALLYIL